MLRPVCVCLISLWPWLAAGPVKFYPDDPLAAAPPPLSVKLAAARKFNEYYDFFSNTFARPGELHYKKRAPVPAQGVNTLGEAPDSEWYTGRHYFRRMSLGELARGPGPGEPPSLEGPWTVVAAKNEGVTPGFTIVDSRGRRYIIKFDPRSNPELATAADVISSKFFYALGYNVPENQIVRFEPSRLRIGEKTLVTDSSGQKRRMTSKDLAEILLKAPREKSGSCRAVASLYLAGRPLGPFRYFGTRPDDPNDTVPHEHRRELRGLRVFCSWLGHDDSRSINTLDMLVEQNGRQYIKHHLIDFGSTLGSASYGPNSPRSGNEYVFSWRPLAREFFSFGFHLPRWARARFPELPAVGRFEHELFDAENWLPEYPNPAFSNQLPEDAFWAARQVMAFTDEEIRAIVKTGEYGDPRAEEWIARALIGRRDKIGRAFLGRGLALDRFAVPGRELVFENLGVQHGFQEPKGTEFSWAEFHNPTGAVKPLAGARGPRIPESSSEYLVATIRSSTTREATPRPGGA
ncbi:MAG: hypothetical protein FJW37_14530, partial [Acidobacteria bacterium]|nr:hypothetical protein [Acidobacteriota bacterium]